MRRFTIISAAVIASMLVLVPAASADPAPPFSQCPAIGADTGCALLIDINSSGQIGIYGDPSQGPFDGADDTLIGIQNDSSSPVSSIPLTSPTGEQVFGFDGDGLCAFITCTWSASTGYEGPNVTFTGISSDETSGTVSLSPALPPGGSTYFSLEQALATQPPFGIIPGSDRYVALGDSVPYGHGLSNPYPFSVPGLPSSETSDGPSAFAYPGLLEQFYGLNMSIRGGNCLVNGSDQLVGDDLAFSGAPAAIADAGSGNDQCPGQFSSSVTLQGDEVPAAQLASNPAQLVTIQAGADDINFASCLEAELLKVGSVHIPGLGTPCVSQGHVTNVVAVELSNVRLQLARMIEQIAPDAQTIAVLNYYQPIPSPQSFASGSLFPGGQADAMCLLLQRQLKSTYTDSGIIQKALNNAIAAGVSDAEGAGVTNVQLVDLSNLEVSHEMCTGKPAIFSAVPMSKVEFAHDMATALFSSAARNDLKLHLWRAVHPNQFGQADIANAVEAKLGAALPAAP